MTHHCTHKMGNQSADGQPTNVKTSCGQEKFFLLETSRTFGNKFWRISIFQFHHLWGRPVEEVDALIVSQWEMNSFFMGMENLPGDDSAKKWVTALFNFS